MVRAFFGTQGALGGAPTISKIADAQNSHGPALRETDQSTVAMAAHSFQSHAGEHMALGLPLRRSWARPCRSWLLPRVLITGARAGRRPKSGGGIEPLGANWNKWELIHTQVSYTERDDDPSSQGVWQWVILADCNFGPPTSANRNPGMARRQLSAD